MGRGGGWVGAWRRRWGRSTDVHTDLSYQLHIWVVRRQKVKVESPEWFAIHVKPVGLGRAFMQRNDLSVCAEIWCEQWWTYSGFASLILKQQFVCGYVMQIAAAYFICFMMPEKFGSEIYCNKKIRWKPKNIFLPSIILLPSMTHIAISKSN